MQYIYFMYSFYTQISIKLYFIFLKCNINNKYKIVIYINI